MFLVHIAYSLVGFGNCKTSSLRTVLAIGNPIDTESIKCKQNHLIQNSNCGLLIEMLYTMMLPRRSPTTMQIYACGAKDIARI